MFKKSFLVLTCACLLVCAGSVSAKTSGTKLPKLNIVSFQAVVNAINGTDYTVEVTKVFNKTNLQVASTVIIHQSARRTSKTKNNNLNKTNTLLKNLGIKINFLSHLKTIKVGDKVTVRGLLQADGSISNGQIVVQSAKGKTRVKK